MSFSFNWNGLSVPQISGGDDYERSLQTARNMGATTRGIVKYNADQEYADILNAGNTNAARISELKQELARLEQRNVELRAMLGNGSMTAVQAQV